VNVESALGESKSIFNSGTKDGPNIPIYSIELLSRFPLDTDAI
jgi:hypothetical protein